ncbi:hypothetical protein [Ancylobacter defluvii]|uniref:Uncharacterized protein n=1 Tax=Ancylobacter defluvii TaxID=1282440 RepID=A0A9W6JZE8_9HYPH|nr:hypothetical protein [Ancylobacter defluvii]MBS7588319.1 hypothetical protein [Ancylobacter defluvii]GLK86716.1 hypothetical protein GCM10017653_47860 [Ancylobacter defluvii]
MMNPAIDYELADDAATTLAACAMLPNRVRVELLEKFAEQHGMPALIEAFAQFVGLANSVVANVRDGAELLLITEGGYHPHDAEKVNLPTIFGALLGVQLARVPQDNPAMCGSCAFRRGSIANQCTSTVIDAGETLGPGEPAFLCHEEDEGVVPHRACGGYAVAKKAARNHKIEAVPNDGHR